MKEILLAFVTNKALISAIAAWALTQGGKNIYEGFKNGFSLKRMTGGGGMPSAHTATVIALLVGSWFNDGGGSSAFAVALFFAIIVMYDAINVRHETGQQARVLNKIREERLAAGEDPLFDEPMEEKMGHTLPEVIVGGIIGFVVAVIVSNLLP